MPGETSRVPARSAAAGPTAGRAPAVGRVRWALLLAGTAGLVLGGCAGDDQPVDAPVPPAARPAAAAPPPLTEDPRAFPPLTAAQAIGIAKRVALVRAGRSTVVDGAPGTPFTRIAFTAEEVLKGRLPRRFVVRVIGGRLGDQQVDPIIAPFVPGRRYILFFGPDGPAGPTIVAQARHEVSAADVVRPGLDGIPLLAAGSSRPARRVAGGRRLDDVLHSIRRYVHHHP